tara:strand:+ start:3613 stop:3999 length:387 start_codon:yes stop_codon:yes gene_type:complete
MNYKYNEIKEYFNDYIKENDSALNDNDFIDELHHHVFNTDYYIIGTYQASQWLGDETFNIINFIKEYENDNFGEVYTDFSSPENIVNMYVYIIGESIVSEYKDNDLYIQAKIEIEDSVSNAKELLNNL